MASVVEQKKDPAARYIAQVEGQIAQATSRIRFHDLAFGALTLAAMLAFYATAVILLDKYFILTEWLRQGLLVGFLATMAAAAYGLIVRPLRKRINPLYAAARVEKTIEDPKNSVMGYVETQEKGEVHAAIKTAMSARAARAVTDADVNRAVDHRSLVVMGSVLVAFLLTLVILFFVFRPAQFNSLLGRAFVPFSADPIATRTQITLVKPDPAEPTITTGQTITVAVHIGGKVPAPGSPGRCRVLIRHTRADVDYEELAMKEGETSRDWQVKVPEDLVLNGFWYKVAAGDSETPEYRVNVRSLPLFTNFEVSYEYPAYMRKPNDKSTSQDIRAYPGTKVTLVAQTNRREVKDGEMQITTRQSVPGKPVPNKPDSLEFKFTVKEQARYRLYMITAGGEKNTDPPFYPINIDTDQPPTVQITKPEEQETSVPANGWLAVDGTVGDDFGIDKVRLRIRIDNRDLEPLPYMNGQSFLRTRDKTWPRDLVYKDSVELSKLKYQDDKTRFEPKEGMVLEYWLEALDNCSEAKPVPDWNDQAGNVGRSAVKQVRLAAPRTEMTEMQDQQKQERKNEEQRHNKNQQQKFDKEKRDQQQQGGNQQQNPDQGANPKPEDGKKEDGKNDPKNGNQTKGQQPKGAENGDMGNPMPKKDDVTQGNPQSPNDPKSADSTNPMKPETKPETKPKPEGMGEPKKDTQNGGMSEPKKDMQNGMGDPNMGMPNEQGGPNNNQNPMPQAPPPQSPEEKRAREEAEKQAQKVKEELEKARKAEGDAKPNPAANPEERTDPAQAKPQPKDGANPEEKPKEGPKPNDGMNGVENAAETKPEGKLEKPMDPSTPKEGPKPDPKGGNQGDKGNPDKSNPAEPRDEPLGGAPGQDKESPEPKKEDQQPNKGPNKQNKQDPGSGATGKPATEKKDEDNRNGGSDGMNDPNAQKDPAAKAGKSKPRTEPSRGEDKNPMGGQGDNEPGSKGGNDQAAKPKEDPMAGKAKDRQSAPSGVSKPGDPMKGEPESSEPKPGEMKPDDQNPTGPAETKPAGDMAPTNKPEDKGVDKGMDKSEQGGNDTPQTPNGQNGSGDKEPKKAKDEKGASKGGNGGAKQDPKQQKELEDAVKELQNPDPKKQQAARDKLDKAIGEQNRKAIEQKQKEQQAEFDQLQKDLKSPDKTTREAAEKKLDEMNRKAEQQARDLEQSVKDLQNPDPKKQQEARDKLDKAIGQKNRQAIEKQQQDEKAKQDQLQQDLQSPDMAKRDAAEKKLNEQKQKAAADAKEIEEAVKDLQNPDPKKQQAARDKLDKKVGEKNRKDIEQAQKKEQEQLEQMEKDLKSPDKEKREAAEKKRDELKKQAEQAAQEAQEAMKDLDSKDPMKQQAARDKLDKLLGEERRKQVEKVLESQKQAGKPIDEDPRNRAKSAELQLEEFEKNKDNKELLERLGWTEQQYEQFLADQRKRLEELQKEAQEVARENENPKPAPGPATIKTDDGGKVEARDNGAKADAASTSGGIAPPGFSNAKKKFLDDYNKLVPKK